MVTPATSFCEAGPETRKLRGRAVVYTARQKARKKNLEFGWGTPLPLGNFCRARSCARNLGWEVMGAVICHELPGECADFSVMMSAGFSK